MPNVLPCKVWLIEKLNYWKQFTLNYSLCTLSNLYRVGDEALIAIGQCCSLQYLNVSGCHQIGDSGLIAIASGCPQLTYLDISVLQVCFFLSPLFCLSSLQLILFVSLLTWKQSYATFPAPF